jgi:hypothetical protein
MRCVTSPLVKRFIEVKGRGWYVTIIEAFWFRVQGLDHKIIEAFWFRVEGWGLRVEILGSGPNPGAVRYVKIIESL